MTAEEKNKPTCILHPYFTELIKEVKTKQDSRPCAAQQVEIEHLKLSDSHQWDHINRLNRTVWFAGGAAFMGSIVAQLIIGLVKRW